MHWKVGHFAAIVKQNGGLYEVQDPTFGENIRVTRATIDQEASGYFVVPGGALPKGWRTVTSAEGNTIWGRGNTTGHDPNGTSPNDRKAFCSSSDCGCGGKGGMTSADVQAMVAGPPETNRGRGQR
jgi:hypothetical protein